MFFTAGGWAVTAEQCRHSTEASSVSYSVAPVNRLGVPNRGGGDTTKPRTAVFHAAQHCAPGQSTEESV